MCGSCKGSDIDRRSLLALGIAVAAANMTRTIAPAIAASGKPTSLSADEALSALKGGNARYVSEPQVCENRSRARPRERGRGPNPRGRPSSAAPTAACPLSWCSVA